MTTNPIVTSFEPDGACNASATHSRTRSAGTGRSKSNRLRTARVVDSSSSESSGNSWVMESSVRCRGLTSGSHPGSGTTSAVVVVLGEDAAADRVGGAQPLLDAVSRSAERGQVGPQRPGPRVRPVHRLPDGTGVECR